jgi:hypothetical protein
MTLIYRTVPKHQSWCAGSRHPKTRELYKHIISRTHRFLNLTVPGLKIMGVRRRSIRLEIMPVSGNIAKKFGFEKFTGFSNYKPDLI